MPIEVGSVASPLGEWTFAKYRPHAADPLVRAIAAAWYFDGVLTHRRERVFPKGVHGLIVQLDEPHRRPDGTPFPPLVYNGIATRAIVVDSPSARTRVIGLEFSAEAGFGFVGRNVGETTDDDVDLQSLLGDDAQRLMESCRAARGARAVLQAAIDWCATRLLRCDSCDPSITAAVARIERARGNVRMRELAAHVGRGERALERAFRERIGLAPKRFARIARFNYAHGLVATGVPLASAAASAGYYDQPHFNADFQEHAGLTPAQFLASQRYPGSTSLAEPR